MVNSYNYLLFIFYLIALCRNYIDDKWRHFDDNNKPEVIKKTHVERFIDAQQNRNPYILFYERRKVTEVTELLEVYKGYVSEFNENSLIIAEENEGMGPDFDVSPVKDTYLLEQEKRSQDIILRKEIEAEQLETADKLEEADKRQNESMKRERSSKYSLYKLSKKAALSQTLQKHFSTKGLPNLGQTCFMNAVLQQFFCLNNFVQSILQTYKEHEASLEYYGYKLFDYLTDTLINHCSDNDEAIGVPLSSFVLEFQKDYDTFPRNKQGDAHEFFLKMYEYLHFVFETVLMEEWNKGARNQGRNKMDALFLFKLKQSITCLKCQSIVDKDVSLSYLPIHISEIVLSLENGIDDFFGREIIDRVEAYFHCTNCNKKRPFTKQYIVKTYPTVFTVQLMLMQEVN